jgi:hypothetical protein
LIGIYFHLYAAGAWETPTREFLEALEEGGLAEQAPIFHLGLVGTPAQTRPALSMVTAFIAPVHVVAVATEGWEQLTLNALHAKPEGDHILYAHTKGAAVVDEWQDAWRRSMYLSLVTEWRDCIPWLEDYDTVGDHWLLPSPGMPQRYPFYGGNCWWARRSYIERLGPPDMATRYDAEAWIGSGEGVTAHVLRPGWPGMDTIRPEARVKPPERVRL